MSEFVSADIFKIANFAEKKDEISKEFDSIKEKFDSINATLLSKWKGEGAKAYEDETNHILENIGGIKDVLDSINDGVITDIRNIYSTLDEDLAEFNLNPQSAEDENSGG